MNELISQERSTTFPFGQEVVWAPDNEAIRDTNLFKFCQKHRIESFDELHSLATDDPAWFWDAVLTDLDIQFKKPYSVAMDASKGIEMPDWCVGGRMNIVHNCLDKWLETDVRDTNAFIWESENGDIVRLSFAELHQRVCKCASALRDLGIGKGDSVGLFMPMNEHLVVAFLAIARIGAVILPLFSGYGPKAITTRLKDGDARAVFTSDVFSRRGKTVQLKTVLDKALEACPDVEHVIVSKCETTSAKEETSACEMMDGRDVYWSDIVPQASSVAPLEDTSAEDVVMIIYTSGTTGQPKGAVHTHCGFPVKSAQDMHQCMDVTRGEMVYWMTDMGWMMGPWLVFGTLLNGSGMLFYDGAPDFPDVSRLWQMVERHGVTHLGLSPVLIRALKSHGPGPVNDADLSRLRAVCSTGSPWDPESWMWTFEHVLKSNRPILNYSGGTEISGGIICGNMYSPLKPCAFSGPVPGMAADVVDENGQSVRGVVGELVIRAPWIGMTRGFWKDPERYHESYWNRFENIWVHGDFAAVDKDGLWYILGRSDDTIKVAGKRVGPAEVEAIANHHPSVRESAAIGAPHDIKGEELVLYCVLEGEVNDLELLKAEVSDVVIREMGKPLKPGAVFVTTALPKTRNAKVMRRLIRSVYLNENAGDTSSLEDPDTLRAIQTAR